MRRLSLGPLPRPALRTGRARLRASGAPRVYVVVAADDPASRLVHGVGIRAPRQRYRSMSAALGENMTTFPSRTSAPGSQWCVSVVHFSPMWRLRSRSTDSVNHPLPMNSARLLGRPTGLSKPTDKARFPNRCGASHHN